MFNHFCKRIRCAVWIMLLVLLAGCAPSKQPFQIVLESELHEMDQTEQDSVISGIRTGIKRQCITSVDNSFECTDEGVYFMCSMNHESWLLYADHESNSIVKLCRREHCAHDSSDCDAWFGNATNICYYDGFLYTVVDMTKLYRISPEGSGRSFVMDAMDVEGSYDGCMTPTVWAGVFSWFMTYQEDGVTMADAYYYKLDGSMDEPAIMHSGYFGGNDGVEFVMNTFLDDQGNPGAFMYSWEPDTNARTFLADRTRYQYGYWGMDASYVYRDGQILKLLPDNSEEVLFDSGITEACRPLFFPDCIVVIQQKELTVLTFFDWEGQLLGSLELNIPLEIAPEMVVCGETDQRIILTGRANFLPEYYIEKSDFGTGTITLHSFELPE